MLELATMNLVGALEAGAGNTAIIDAFKTGVESISTSLSGMITGLLPIILGVIGLVIAVTFGIKFVRKTIK